MTRLLITTSRMPFALDEIRKLGRAGHAIVATDTFATAPGSHSRYVEEAIVTPSPRYDTAAYLDAIEDIVVSRRIEYIVPTFEEVFYLARHRERFARHAELFASSFETLRTLHDKARFLQLVQQLGLPAPRTIIVSDRGSLAAAARELGEFFARPAYSRGGVNLYTNVGPLAGALSIEQCNPTAENPWLVQAFVHGTDVCTFSLAHHGELVAHSTYVHPRMLEHAGGITFESIDESGTLAIARRIVAATKYHGQISLDFLRTPQGLSLVECNPRPTAGVYVMPPEMFVKALLHPRHGETLVAPPGAKRKINIALVRDMIRHLDEVPADLAALFSKAPDVYAEAEDMVPAIFQLLSYSHVLKYRYRNRAGRNKRTDLMAAYFDDVQWDGEAMGDEGEDEDEDEDALVAS